METPVFRAPGIADIFERILVPAIFDRYARDLVERARPIGPSDRILDLGCGTGIVARIVRERLGGAAHLTGVDTSAPMIAVAKSLLPEAVLIEGNAMALPFADCSFDLILCQQMLQFVPDRVLALREARRVLAPGGRIMLSTWKPRAQQPLFDALGVVAEQHLGTSNDKRWSLDGDELRALLIEAGFANVQLDSASLTEHYKEFPVRGSTMAANFDLASLSDAEREHKLAAVEAASTSVLQRFTIDGFITARSITNIATATAA